MKKMPTDTKKEEKEMPIQGTGATQHTPGPWAIHPTRESRDRRKCSKDPTYLPWFIVPASHTERPIGGSVDDAKDLSHYAQNICSLQSSRRHRSNEELNANALLIASAPDLLAENAALRTEVERLRGQLMAAVKGMEAVQTCHVALLNALQEQENSLWMGVVFMNDRLSATFWAAKEACK